MQLDPYILAFSLITVVVTVWMGFRSARSSRTAQDFYVAGRSVSVGWNASAISGEYLSAASFMGIAGMVMSSGYDALWYPVCYACGYLFLLLFIAGPLRRFGAYTIPDFAEGRFDSPLFRKIAVVFVLFIGFFYTMPQMKGAGTTLAYILPGLPYWAGVVLVGAVITLNVALGGMKGITLVQAFQYWLKMFAISVPIFVLMAVYGHYGTQVGLNGRAAPDPHATPALIPVPVGPPPEHPGTLPDAGRYLAAGGMHRGFPAWKNAWTDFRGRERGLKVSLAARTYALHELLDEYAQSQVWQRGVRRVSGWIARDISELPIPYAQSEPLSRDQFALHLRHVLASNGVTLVHLTPELYQAVPTAQAAAYGIEFRPEPAATGRAPLPAKAPADATWLEPFGPLTTKAAKAAQLTPEASRPYALLYTYSLLIALVCGTAGLPHILVRFYTNPDGTAAKRTTMWVMILIGVFYVFPPVFGVMGRNLLPELYAATGAKGTDKVVLELPRLLNAHWAPLGSILSGITCAGAFAAFMSTFSGLLVSMTGALAHDVYGRMLRPQATPAQRLRMFKLAAVLLGSGAVVAGTFVEPFQINFMVGQAFAIAAASYFPLLFMSIWWRGLTMKGAATGMLAGGALAVAAISLVSFSDLAVAGGRTSELFAWFQPLDAFWKTHPLLRILCEQPALWAVPLALSLMLVVSKWTARDIPRDIRMKMLVLHAPEALGLKREYIQEHAPRA